MIINMLPSILKIINIFIFKIEGSIRHCNNCDYNREGTVLCKNQKKLKIAWGNLTLNKVRLYY